MKHKGVPIETTRNPIRRYRDRNTPLCCYCEGYSVVSIRDQVKPYCRRCRDYCTYVRGTKRCKFVRG